MFLDRILHFRRGFDLTISSAALRSLIGDASSGRRLPELLQVTRFEDIFPYLSVTVHRGAPELIRRRARWARGVRDDILAGRQVSYLEFDRLFWRDLDEEDPDGDEWHRMVDGEAFAGEIVVLLDGVRAVQRGLRRSDDVLIRLSMDLWNGEAMPQNGLAF